MARRPSLRLGVLALTLVLASCGSSEGSTTTASTTTVAGGTDASVTAAVVAALAPDTGDGLFSAESAQCVAQGLIDQIGLDRMVSLTGTSESAAGDPTAIFGLMTVDEVPLALAAVERCVDLQTVLEADLTLGGFAADGAGCVGDALVQAGYGDIYFESLLTGSDTSADTGFDAAFVNAFAQQCPDATHQLVINDFTTWGVSVESATCVADAFVQGGSLRSVVTVILGVTDSSVDSAVVDSYMTQVYLDCLTPEEQATLGITATTSTTGAATATTQP